MEGPYSSSKRHLASFLQDVPNAQSNEICSVLEKYCHPDCVWSFFHPFVGEQGNEQAANTFWHSLKSAFPDYEFRPALLLAGDYEEAQQVSMLGFLMGNHMGSWLGVPPNHQLTLLRFGLNVKLHEGRIAHAYVMFDLIDLIRQAGFYPFRPMPGSPEQWPFCPGDAGFSLEGEDPATGARTLEIVREMQAGLPAAGKVVDQATAAASHSPHWCENMNWFGPAGIGSSRGMRGFRDYHGALFLKAFPDRHDLPRDTEGPDNRPGHFCEIGEGRLAMTAGWPAMRGTHSGGQWLGLPPSGARVEMRVADWYRLTPESRLADNWVLIDIPHMLDQMGLDILDDLRFFVEPQTSRLN